MKIMTNLTIQFISILNDFLRPKITINNFKNVSIILAKLGGRVRPTMENPLFNFSLMKASLRDRTS